MIQLESREQRDRRALTNISCHCQQALLAWHPREPQGRMTAEGFCPSEIRGQGTRSWCSGQGEGATPSWTPSPGLHGAVLRTQCCLAWWSRCAPEALHAPPQTRLPRTLSRVHPCDLSETSPHSPHSGVFLLNYCRIYYLSAPDWMREKNLFLGARRYTRSYLIFTVFLWGKYNSFIL